MKSNYLYCLLLAIVFNIQFSIGATETDSVIIRVHFLHGSKPKKEFKRTEDRWFGGVLGGHAGIEVSPDRVFNFQPKSGIHLFSKKSIINSKFGMHDTISFYEILGGKCDSVKRTVIGVKISARQKTTLDSIVMVYTKHCPYDYAFFGMRCGAAAYDVLAQIGVVKKTSFNRTWRRIFYPRKLRRLLEAKIYKGIISVVKKKGSNRRKWEKD